jgi:hypothetical protein
MPTHKDQTARLSAADYKAFIISDLDVNKNWVQLNIDSIFAS